MDDEGDQDHINMHVELDYEGLSFFQSPVLSAINECVS
jgi:hypothetical protein